MNAIDAPKAKDPNNEEDVPHAALPDEDDEANDPDITYWKSSMKPIKLLYEHYGEIHAVDRFGSRGQRR